MVSSLVKLHIVPTPSCLFARIELISGVRGPPPVVAGRTAVIPTAASETARKTRRIPETMVDVGAETMDKTNENHISCSLKPHL